MRAMTITDITDTTNVTPVVPVVLHRAPVALEEASETPTIGVPGDVPGRELMAPGHLYNPRTGTGIEWLPANLDTGERGKARLWAREWNGQPIVLAEAIHNTVSAWEYWYNLEFANSFPQVTHWWFGDAWTGSVRIWRPDVVAHDPESGAPMLTGWMRFGILDTDTHDTLEAPDAPDTPDAPVLPWTVVLTNPPRVNTPFPPMAANLTNLPLQLLLAERVMEVLARLAEQAIYNEEIANNTALEAEIIITSLVRREDLHRAFPDEFGPWQLDKLPDLTAREALCRVQGLEPPAQSV